MTVKLPLMRKKVERGKLVSHTEPCYRSRHTGEKQGESRIFPCDPPVDLSSSFNVTSVIITRHQFSPFHSIGKRRSLWLFADFTQNFNDELRNSRILLAQLQVHIIYRCLKNASCTLFHSGHWMDNGLLVLSYFVVSCLLFLVDWILMFVSGKPINRWQMLKK